MRMVELSSERLEQVSYRLHTSDVPVNSLTLYSTKDMKNKLFDLNRMIQNREQLLLLGAFDTECKLTTTLGQGAWDSIGNNKMND